jgi:iron-sulfur cluster assembly accessory protein
MKQSGIEDRGRGAKRRHPLAFERQYPYTPPKETHMSVGATETQPTPEAQPANALAAATVVEGDAPEALVALSDKAAEKVREIRTEENIEDTYALRLKVQGGGCSGFSYDLYFDQPQETDRAFDVKGVKLICDEMSLMYLVGTEVDYVEGLHGAGFKFQNPNVKSTCGCGSSFSV